MRELQIFAAHLKKLMVEKRAMSNAIILSRTDLDGLHLARASAMEAELLKALLIDADDLERDPASFVKRAGL